MTINNVVVIGAGQMGKQIALNSAIYGYKVILNDVFPDALNAAEKWKNEYLDGRVAKGKMSAEQIKEISARMTIEADLAQAVKDADLVIEAIIEKEANKQELFAQLDQLTKAETILASNSSFIPSSVVAKSTKRPDKIANLHFFNPALTMLLVEVVQGNHTSEDTAKALIEFAQKSEKKPIWLKKEIEGFVANRILNKITAEALFLVENGIVSPEEVDIATENGLNHPMGPFRLMDLIGIDISYLSRERRYAITKDEKDKPPAFLAEKVQKGELGRKTGKGWYDYTKPSSK